MVDNKIIKFYLQQKEIYLKTCQKLVKQKAIIFSNFAVSLKATFYLDFVKLGFVGNGMFIC